MLQIEWMVQCVVIVFHVVVGQGVAADDQLQSVTSLCDQWYGQAAVEVPRPHVVHLDRQKNVGSGKHFMADSIWTVKVESQQSPMIVGFNTGYLQNPVIGFKSSTVSRPIRSDHVDINAFFQEAI